MITKAELTQARNTLIGIRNDIEADTERGKLTLNEEAMYSYLINATIHLIDIRSYTRLDLDLAEQHHT